MNGCKFLRHAILSSIKTHMSAEVKTRTDTSVITSRNGCSKCGNIKKSGKLSCCARGGAWYKNCGDEGDAKFGHTWAQGIHACEGTLSRL